MVDVTGRKDAVNIKKKYQRDINQAYVRIGNKVKFLYKMNHKLKTAMSDLKRLERDITVDIEEKSDLVEELSNLLDREHIFEKEQLTTRLQNNKKVTSVSVKQKFKESEIDDLNYSQMMDNFKYNPKTEIKDSVDKYRDKITELQKNIKTNKKSYNDAYSRAITEIEYFPRNFIEANNTIQTYNRIFKEAEDNLYSMRYFDSIPYKMASESSKLDVKLDTINHKINEYEDTINRLEEEVKQSENNLEKYHLEQTKE